LSEFDELKKDNFPVFRKDSERFQIALKMPFERAGLILLKMLSPCLAFAVYFIASNTLWAVLGQHLHSTQIIGICIGFVLCLSYLSILTLFLKKDIILRQSSIQLPAQFILLTWGKLTWRWSNLQALTFAKTTPDIDSADQIVLTFQDEHMTEPLTVHIKLSEIEQIDLKKLVYAIVTNAPHAVIEPALNEVALEFPTVSGIKHLNFNSFTSLWDEEFSTRYSPTLFVPLAPADELRNGSIKITELIACGGSAAIYSAKDSRGEQIIVKEAVIPKNTPEALKAKAIEMFNREAMFLSLLDHPYIAKVMDHFVEKEHHYEVIEYIDGLDLRRFVKERGPQPEDFVLNWAQQICEILVYLHGQEPPVIHRDLTPDNLVLRVDGQLILIDFGAANAFVGTATGTMVGKQSYMPPEQLRGKAVPQSDIYSLGGTCYFLLTGKDPTPLEVSQVRDNKPGTQLNPLLAKCTALDSAERYQSSEELLREILSLRQQRIKDETVQALPKSS
jgi:tRNA A-37 threonylcarbamoyl transferase component Bud32